MAEPVLLRFHRSLYAPEAVARAAERFGGLVGAITVDTHPHDVTVTLVDIPERLAGRLPDELANHALFETILAARGTPA